MNVLVNELKTEIKRLKEENISVLSRLSYLEGVAEASIGNSGVRNMDICASYQVPMQTEGHLINEIDMFHEIEAVGVGIGGQDYEGFVNLTAGN